MIGDILEMDTPLEYFFNGNLAQSLGEAAKKCHLLDTLFLIQGGFFIPPIGTIRVLVPSIVSSLKSSEDHLL